MPVVVLISFLAQPRLNYALACDGLMPQIFAKVDEKGTIYWGTMISGIFFTVVAFLVPFSVLWDLVSFGILLSFIMSNTSLLMVRTRDHSPTLAPKLIGGMVFFSLLSTFLYQIGYVNNEKGACLVFAIIFFVGVVGCTGILYMKCPQSANEPGNFAAPFVPFIPMLSILADWYLIAQISVVGMGLGMGWVALAILSYFAYGFNHSAGRTEWNALLNFLPHGDRMSTPMLSMNEVRPSMSSMMKEKENKM
jgi:APA family basic amino acid/polyamine antiporter